LLAFSPFPAKAFRYETFIRKVFHYETQFLAFSFSLARGESAHRPGKPARRLSAADALQHQACALRMAWLTSCGV
jgi:hypothetical protein